MKAFGIVLALLVLGAAVWLWSSAPAPQAGPSEARAEPGPSIVDVPATEDADAGPATALPAHPIDDPLPPLDEIAAEVVIRRGELSSVGDAPPVSGRVALYAIDGGEALLRFEDLSIDSQADLVVLLCRKPDPRSAADLAEGQLALGPLKSQRGDQNYPIEAEMDVSGYRTAALFSPTANKIFAAAALN